MLGVSPSTWQNIAALGSGMIAGANQRTADGHLANGTGFAGGFGAGVQNYLNSANQQAQMRSQAAHQQAETQGLNLQNQITGMGIPFMQQRMQFQQQMMSDPRFRQMLMSNMGMGDASAAAPSGQTDPTGYAGAVNAMEGGPQKNPSSSASGYGQLLDENKTKFAQANPQYFQGAQTPQDVAARFNVPAVGMAATNWLAQQNAPVLSQAGVPVTGPNLAMAHRLGPTAAAAVAQAPDNTPLPAVLVQSLGPQEAARVVAANPTLMRQTAGPYKAQFSNVPAWGGSGGGQGMLAQADRLLQQAGQIDLQKSMGLPTNQDPASLREAARQLRESGLKLMTAGPVAGASKAAEANVEMQTAGPIAGAKKAAEANVDLQTAGPIQREKSANSNVDLRPGGLSRVVNPTTGQPEWIKNPQLENSVDPKTGQKGYVHISPALPDAPPGTPGTMEPVLGPNGKPVISGLGPQQTAFGEHFGAGLAKDFDETNESAAAAKNSNYLFDNMRQDSKNWDMGAFAPAEAKARSYLSAMAQLFDIKGPATDALNQKLSDYTAFNKSSGMLLREAVHDTSSRAAVQEYKLIGESLPHPTTSPQAFGQVADQWQALNDFRLAKQKFMQPYKPEAGGNPSDFEVDFNSRVSPSAFMINRMTQSPEGQDTFQRMMGNMQKTEEGRLTVGRMWAGYRYAKQNGLFDDLPPIGATGGQPQLPPAPGAH